jgi:hypothetical protein
MPMSRTSGIRVVRTSYPDTTVEAELDVTVAVYRYDPSGEMQVRRPSRPMAPTMRRISIMTSPTQKLYPSSASLRRLGL